MVSRFTAKVSLRFRTDELNNFSKPKLAKPNPPNSTYHDRTFSQCARGCNEWVVPRNVAQRGNAKYKGKGRRPCLQRCGLKGSFQPL